jgi:hypothetical protein
VAFVPERPSGKRDVRHLFFNHENRGEDGEQHGNVEESEVIGDDDIAEWALSRVYPVHVYAHDADYPFSPQADQEAGPLLMQTAQMKALAEAHGPVQQPGPENHRHHAYQEENKPHLPFPLETSPACYRKKGSAEQSPK